MSFARGPRFEPCSSRSARRFRIIGRLDNGLKRKLITALVLVFIAGLLYLFATPDYRQGEPSLTGKTAPDFALTLDGKPAHLSDFRGKVVFLNFWATWCPPCVEEAPSLEKLQTRIAPLGGTVVGVSVDDNPGRIPGIPRPLRTHLSQLSRHHETDPENLRHRDVPRHLHHRSQRPLRPQNHRRSGLDQPTNDRLH